MATRTLSGETAIERIKYAWAGLRWAIWIAAVNLLLLMALLVPVELWFGRWLDGPGAISMLDAYSKDGALPFAPGLPDQAPDAGREVLHVTDRGDHPRQVRRGARAPEADVVLGDHAGRKRLE